METTQTPAITPADHNPNECLVLDGESWRRLRPEDYTDTEGDPGNFIYCPVCGTIAVA